MSQKSEVRSLGQVALNVAASGWTKRRAPHRSGVRLIVEAGAFSSQACMGLGLDGPESLGLRQFRLGLGELGIYLSVFRPKPKALDLSNSL